MPRGPCTKRQQRAMNRFSLALRAQNGQDQTYEPVAVKQEGGETIRILSPQWKGEHQKGDIRLASTAGIHIGRNSIPYERYSPFHICFSCLCRTCRDHIWACATWASKPDINATAVQNQDFMRFLMRIPRAGWGDGHHPTTWLSLQFLAQRIKPGLKQKVLDYGTGSAVLAMASIRFGCESALGVDIDDEALVRTLSNTAYCASSGIPLKALLCAQMHITMMHDYMYPRVSKTLKNICIWRGCPLWKECAWACFEAHCKISPLLCRYYAETQENSSAFHPCRLFSTLHFCFHACRAMC